MDANLPFFVTQPGSTDVLMLAIGVLLVAALLGVGTLYFTVQTIPDRMASGSHKIQMQLVGLLGVISLFTMNNAFWIAGILLAAIPFHELFPKHFATITNAFDAPKDDPVPDPTENKSDAGDDETTVEEQDNA